MISAATARTQEIHVLDNAKRGYIRKPAILFSGRRSDSIKSLAGDGYEMLKIKRVADDHLLVRDQLGQERRWRKRRCNWPASSPSNKPTANWPSAPAIG